MNGKHLSVNLHELKNVLIAQLRRLGLSYHLSMLLGSQILTAITALLYGKLITVYIDPAVFGGYNVQSVALILLIALLGSPTIQSFLSASQQRGIQSVMPVYTGILIIIFSFSLVCISILYWVDVVEGWVFAAWLTGVFHCMFSICLGILLATNHLKAYALLQSLNPLINLLLLIIIITTTDYPNTNHLWVNVLFLNIFFFLITAYVTHRFNPSFKPVFRWLAASDDQENIKAFRVFVTPLIGYALFSWLNNYADRYIINALLTSSSVAFYATAYSLGSRLSIIGGPIVTNLNPLMHAARREKRHMDTNSLISRYLILLWSIGLPVCLLLHYFQNEIGYFILSQKYQPAFKLVPIIGLSAVCLHSLQLFETKFLVYERTSFILFHSVIGAIVNISLNWLFIPAFGLVGAALATLISISVQVFVAVLLNKRMNFIG